MGEGSERRLTHRIAFLISALAAAAAGAAPTTEHKEPPRQVVQGSDSFEFVYRVTLPRIESSLSLWIPLAKSDSHQTVQVDRISAPTGWKQLSDREFANDILYLSAGPAASGAVIEVRYSVRRFEKSAYAATEQQMSRYLKAEQLVPIDERFRKIALDVTAGRTGAGQQGKALYDHVLDRMRYEKSGDGWGRGDALWACDARTGNCTDFHSYFIALARSIGIPARFAIGATIPADSDGGEIGGYHCWAEFHDGSRWIPVDISEADKNPTLAAYYFGHHPANRIELSRGRDLVVVPGPSSGPINFLAYPVMEVDGKEMKPETVFSFKRIEAEHPG